MCPECQTPVPTHTTLAVVECAKRGRMKYSAVYLAFALLGQCFAIVVTASKDVYVPFFSFGNHTEEPELSCTQEEMLTIWDALGSLAPKSRRNLRRRWCGPFICGDGSTSTGRRRAEETAQIESSIPLEKCAIDFAKVNATLADLAKRVTPSCRANIASPMTAICLRKVECDISHFAL
jgi:hypothetical protein